MVSRCGADGHSGGHLLAVAMATAVQHLLLLLLMGHGLLLLMAVVLVLLMLLLDDVFPGRVAVTVAVRVAVLVTSMIVRRGDGGHRAGQPGLRFRRQPRAQQALRLRLGQETLLLRVRRRPRRVVAAHTQKNTDSDLAETVTFGRFE